jgi:hypothetical protein
MYFALRGAADVMKKRVHQLGCVVSLYEVPYRGTTCILLFHVSTQLDVEDSCSHMGVTV